MTTHTDDLAKRAPLAARLLIRTGQDGLWLGPAFAVLCGAAAGGAFSWQGVDALRLALVLVVPGWLVARALRAWVEHR